MTGLQAEVSDDRADRRRGHLKSRTLESPEVDAEDTVSEKCDRALRPYYGIRAADPELSSDNTTGTRRSCPTRRGRRTRAENVDQENTERGQADR